jgi:hypothetical protein
VPPLVRRKRKGYAAPQDPVPWWEGVVAYLLLVPGVLVWAGGMPVFLGFWGCAESDKTACLGIDQLLSSTGDEGTVIRAAAFCYLFAMLAAVAVQLTVGRLHFAIVWTMAVSVVVLSLLGIGIMSGVLGTPWGQLYETGTSGPGG